MSIKKFLSSLEKRAYLHSTDDFVAEMITTMQKRPGDVFAVMNSFLKEMELSLEQETKDTIQKQPYYAFYQQACDDIGHLASWSAKIESILEAYVDDDNFKSFLEGFILLFKRHFTTIANLIQMSEPDREKQIRYYKECADRFQRYSSSIKPFTKIAQESWEFEVSEEPEVVIRDKNGLRIGIDIDGVLADTHSVLMDLASEHVPIDDEDRQKYGVQETKHGSDGLRNQVFEEIFEKGLIAEAPMIPGAADKVNELYDAGNEIYIITARKKNWEEQTKEWLKNNGIKYHKLIMGAGKKGDVAKEEGIDVFIEDSSDNIENLEGNGIRAFVFSQPWNQDSHAERIEQWKNVKASKESPTLEMEDFFKERTAKHIDLVNKYLEKLKEHYDYEFKDAHDNSKYADPEHEPYLYITWKHKMRDEDEDYEIPEEWKDKCDEATFHHIKNNRHHPEYWDDTLTENPINKEDRDEPSGKIVDATKMPEEHILAMVADWCAMSEEKENTPKEWADKNIGVRWEFSPEQEELIYEAIEKIWNKKADGSIKSFTKKAANEPVLFTVARGMSGELSDLAREGKDIPESHSGINYWIQIGVLGDLSGVDPSIYGSEEGVVIAKTITLKSDDELKTYQFPPGWYHISSESHKDDPRYHIAKVSPFDSDNDLLDVIPQEILGEAEIASEGPITGYTLVNDSKKHEISPSRKDAPHWKGRTPTEKEMEEYQEPETIKVYQSVKSFTKFSSPRWTPEDKVRLKELYIKYRQRGIPHHIIYKAAAILLDKTWLAVKQKLESMYGLEDELKGMKFEHWDKEKIDKTIQDLYSTGKPINRINLPANLMYQITNHSAPKSHSQGFPTFYNSFDDAMASNILVIGFEREGDKLTEKPIKTLEDALKLYRRKEKLCHTWTKDEIVELLQEAHVVGLPLTYSFFRSHPDIYKPLMGVSRSLEGLRDSIKRNGYTWCNLVVEAVPEYADFYSEDGRMKSSTEEMRVRRFLELNNIPFKTAGDVEKIAVNDPELNEMGYKHFLPDFVVLDKSGNVSAYVEVFGSIADSGASNTAELYREKKKAKEKFYSTLPYRFIAVNNNTDGIDLTDEILKQKFGSFLGM